MASSSNHQMTKEASRSKRKSLLKPRTLEMSEGAEGLRSHWLAKKVGYMTRPYARSVNLMRLRR